MKEMIGYVIAQKLEPEKDTMGLLDPVFYFNLADAQAQRQNHEIILQIIIPHPQNGNGGFEKNG